MKKLFTLAIIAASIQASAQFNQSISTKQKLTLIPFENSHRSKMNEESQTPGIQKIAGKNAIQLLKMNEQPITLVNDSTYYWKWDKTNSDWIISSKQICLYNSNNDLISGVLQNWDGTTWVNYFLESQSFDANNNKIYFSFQFWENNSWAKINEYSFTYDINNKLSATLEKSWNGSLWVNSTLSSCMYNDNSELTSVTDQTWDGSSWVNSKLSSYTYDANNNLTSSLIQNWDGNRWANSDLYTYTYDLNNNQTSNLYQKDWYGGNTWENLVLVSNTFDANNNQTTKLSQSWKNNAWANNYLDSNSYNFNNKLTYIESKYYNNNAWENSGQEFFSYDTINNTTSSIYNYWYNNAWVLSHQTLLSFNSSNPLYLNNSMSKTWDVSGAYVNNGDSVSYYYHTPVTEISNFKETGISIYPNPSKGKFTINKTGTTGYIDIYNSIGILIYSDLEFNPQTAKEIDLSGYPKGIYFVKINNEMNSITKKVIIQ